MTKYVIKRLFYLIPVLIGVSFIVFTLLYITPGDPARLVLGQLADQEAVNSLREEMGLNDSFLIQYINYLKGILKGDLGTSYVTKKPVLSEILDVFPNTVKLASSAIFLAIILGNIFGIISAVKQYSIIDSIISVIALFGISMPMFWVGLLMIILFSVKLGWFPSSGYDGFKYMIMPAIALGAQSIAIITRMTRSSMLETLHSDYIDTAKAKGQTNFIIIWKHVYRNALIPIVTITGLQFGYLLGGAIITETIFGIPGLGRLMVESIKMRDYPVVLGSVFFFAVCFSLVNLIVDLLYVYIDPKIKRL